MLRGTIPEPADQSRSDPSYLRTPHVLPFLRRVVSHGVMSATQRSWTCCRVNDVIPPLASQADGAVALTPATQRVVAAIDITMNIALVMGHFMLDDLRSSMPGCYHGCLKLLSHDCLS